MNELFTNCPECKSVISKLDLSENHYICPHCGNYMRMTAAQRLKAILDKDSFEELFEDIGFFNSIDFPDYEEKYEAAVLASGLKEAVVTGMGTIGGRPLCIAVMDGNFMMGSMGKAVGEKITRIIDTAVEKRLPFVIFTASGGARMQEGIVSLMQMAKTAAAVERLNEAGLLYTVVLTNPTCGGVSASFAMLGDVILAEPGALICFAGPRVVRQATKKELPEGFQKSEDVLQRGFVDAIVSRKELRSTLAFLLEVHDVKEDSDNEG